MKNNILKEERFIFDLDRTIWDTFDIRGNKIWAKQLLPPFTKNDENTIIDDVGSSCKLRKGVLEFFERLWRANKKIGFLSSGAINGYPKQFQPSINLLKEFDIYKYFNDIKILKYKTFSKYNFFKEGEACVFFDDDNKHLDAVKGLDHICEVDSKDINNWMSFYEL
jgi:predicted phosphatase